MFNIFKFLIPWIIILIMACAPTSYDIAINSNNSLEERFASTDQYRMEAKDQWDYRKSIDLYKIIAKDANNETHIYLSALDRLWAYTSVNNSNDIRTLAACAILDVASKNNFRNRGLHEKISHFLVQSLKDKALGETGQFEISVCILDNYIFAQLKERPEYKMAFSFLYEIAQSNKDSSIRFMAADTIYGSNRKQLFRNEDSLNKIIDVFIQLSNSSENHLAFKSIVNLSQLLSDLTDPVKREGVIKAILKASTKLSRKKNFLLRTF